MFNGLKHHLICDVDMFEVKNQEFNAIQVRYKKNAEAYRNGDTFIETDNLNPYTFETLDLEEQIISLGEHIEEKYGCFVFTTFLDPTRQKYTLEWK